MAALNWSVACVVDFNHWGRYVNPRNVYVNPGDVWRNHAHPWTVNLGHFNHDWGEVGVVGKSEIVVSQTNTSQFGLEPSFDPGAVGFKAGQLSLLAVG